MDKPDLREMATRASELYEALEALDRTLEEARQAADGDWDEENDVIVPDTGNGDRADLFTDALKEVHDAMRCMASTRRLLATQQGLREFAESAVWGA